MLPAPDLFLPRCLHFASYSSRDLGNLYIDGSHQPCAADRHACVNLVKLEIRDELASCSSSSFLTINCPLPAAVSVLQDFWGSLSAARNVLITFMLSPHLTQDGFNMGQLSKARPIKSVPALSDRCLLDPRAVLYCGTQQFGLCHVRHNSKSDEVHGYRVGPVMTNVYR